LKNKLFFYYLNLNMNVYILSNIILLFVKLIIKYLKVLNLIHTKILL
jgi:hypothetical protein